MLNGRQNDSDNSAHGRMGSVRAKITAIVISCVVVAIAGILVLTESVPAGLIPQWDLIKPPEADESIDSPVPVPVGRKELPKAPIGGGVKLELEPLPGEDGLSLVELYRKCGNWVVAITAKMGAAGYSWGTGIIVSQNGYIVTNDHIIEDASSVSVTLADDREFEASLVGSDKASDLAVLKIEAFNLQDAVFGDSSMLEVGQTVAAVGNPLGKSFRGTITDGIISAIDRDMEYNGYSMTLLQTNAAINEGNSGGPLLNMFGQIIGITNMKIISSYSNVEGIGFAIPTSTIKSVVDELIEKGYVQGAPMIGIEGGEPPQEYPRREKLVAGVFVYYVNEKSDAFKKGLRQGDIITAIQNRSVTSVADIDKIKEGYLVGDTIKFAVARKSRSFEIDIVLCEAALLED